MVDVRGRLSAPELDARLRRLSFRDDDREELLKAADAVAGSPELLNQVTGLVDRLLPIIGVLDPEPGADPFNCAAGCSDDLGAGVLSMLALVATVEEVQAFHRSRGISEELSWRALSDLGQQTYVHRLTYGSFGLHTQGWLCVAWSGALYWLGRLQFNLHREGAEWLLSTHIPRTGPLTPASVDASFAQAVQFFGEHFPDYQLSGFFCSSWLLDPELAAALSPTSNMACFQRRWNLFGEPMKGDADALFFTFARRGDIDLDCLPQDTSLQRAIVGRLRSGGHWHVWNGRKPLSSVPEQRLGLTR
jgi:hypothetical protein